MPLLRNSPFGLLWEYALVSAGGSEEIRRDDGFATALAVRRRTFVSFFLNSATLGSVQKPWRIKEDELKVVNSRTT